MIWFLNHVANPFVRPLLRSRAHRLVSGSLLLLTFTGRRSGKRYTIPVGYTEENGSLLVAVGRPERKCWWRNLRGGAEVTVLLQGEARRGFADVLKTDGAVAVRIRLERQTKGGHHE